MYGKRVDSPEVLLALEPVILRTRRLSTCMIKLKPWRGVWLVLTVGVGVTNLILWVLRSGEPFLDAGKGHCYEGIVRRMQAWWV